jgi:hypothetical protein
MRNPFLDDPPTEAAPRSWACIAALFLLSLLTRGWRDTVDDLGAFWEIR